MSKRSSLAFRNKSLYVRISLVFSLFLLGLVVVDYTITTKYEIASAVTTKWTLSIMSLHVCSFYMFVLGFIYSNHSQSRGQHIAAVLCGIINAVGFVLRVIFEIFFMDFHPQKFSSE